MTETNKQYLKMNEMAKRYAVGKRTIQNWMNAGLLIYIRVRRVVRFDAEACDKVLREHGFLS